MHDQASDAWYMAVGTLCSYTEGVRNEYGKYQYVFTLKTPNPPESEESKRARFTRQQKIRDLGWRITKLKEEKVEYNKMHLVRDRIEKLEKQLEELRRLHVSA